MPNHTPTQLAELRRLLSRPHSSPSGKAKVRCRVKALIALCEAKALPVIIREAPITRAGLQKLRNRVDTHGIGSEIEKASRSLSPKEEPSDSGQKRHRGKPPIPSLSAWTELQHHEHEPVVELVHQFLTSTIKWAVIGMRPASSKSDFARSRGARAVEKLVRDAWAQDDVLKWTSNGLDWDAERLFWRLREEAKRMIEPEWMVDFAPLLLSFSAPWRFIVFHTGATPPDGATSEEVAARIVECISLPNDTFLNDLEGLIYRLRVRENLIGLFPAFGLFRQRVLDETLQVPARQFLWLVDEADIDAALKRRLVEFYIYAISGLVFELPAKLRKAIPQKQRSHIETLTLRPRIEAYDHTEGADTVTVEYQPIPEVGFRYVTKRPISDVPLAEGLRKFLRRRGQKLTLEYSVRLEQDQTRTAYPEEFATGVWRESATQRVAVVSVPRQWLMEPPCLPLPKIAELDQWTTGAAQRLAPARSAVPEPSLLFHAPLLAGAIRAAFESNRYGDRLAAITRFEHRIREESRDGGRRFSGWLGPFFYFSADDLLGKNISIQTLRRLADSPIDYRAACEFGNPEGTKGILHPSYDVEKVFQRLFTEHDADFLLREIDEPVWQELSALTKEWTKLTLEVIAEQYWTKGKIVNKLVLSTIRPTLREDAQNMIDLVRGWTSDVLNGFVAGGDRVLRHAVETAQRFAVVGLTPVFSVVRTEKDILRSWKSYLGQHLNGQIVEERIRRASGKRGHAHQEEEARGHKKTNYPTSATSGRR